MYRLGGLKVQGRGEKSARGILEDARKLEKVGVFSLVLECIPWQLSKLITERVHIPAIGIGAGPYCDGQVLVIHDLLGLSGFQPKFVKSYAQLSNPIMRAIGEFTREVREGKFPSLNQSYEMPEKELKQLLRNLRRRR
jgi:3-methyl-2-oxobutanoate hydroxymethyltransferase